MRSIPARLWALAVLSGVLQVLPFPIAGPVLLWRAAFCWFCVTPLLMALLGQRNDGRPLRARQAALLGYACGLIWYLGNCYWIYPTMYLYGGLPKPVAAGILVLFSLYLGLYHALFGGLIGLLRAKLGKQGALLLAPFVWVAVELARAQITGFPWDLLGVAQVDNPVLTLLAPWTGAYGLSFVIAAVNSAWLLRMVLRKRNATYAGLIAAGCCLVLGYGLLLRHVLSRAPSVPNAVATLVQDNLSVGAEQRTGLPLSKEEMLAKFAELSRYPAASVLAGTPEMPATRTVPLAPLPGPRPTSLIVWPEAPTPFQYDDPEFRAAMSALAEQASAPIIVDNVRFVRDSADTHGYRHYNAAAFINSAGEFTGSYEKMHLVPFGEYVPYKQLFFFAGSLLGEAGDFSAGANRSMFKTGGHTYGVFICYESIFGDEIREFAKNGAEVLVNLSDDGWYGDTSAPWQHLNMVRMRAIENHRWILRSTNTGITGSIDPYGRVVASAPRHQRTAIAVGFRYETVRTFYSRFGDVFADGCAAVTLLALVIVFQLRRKPVESRHHVERS